MRCIFTGVMLIFLALSFSAARGAGQKTVLGVLEDVPGVHAGQPNSHGVRVAFQKNGKNWQAFPSECAHQGCLKTVSAQYPREVVWTIVFDGRSLGQVVGKTPEEFRFYSHVGLQEVKGRSVPTIGKRSAEYGGFTDASVYRSLVANSQPYFKDPESWKPSQLSTGVVRLLREQFRRKFQRCPIAPIPTKTSPNLRHIEMKTSESLKPILPRMPGPWRGCNSKNIVAMALRTTPLLTSGLQSHQHCRSRS